MSTLTDEQIEEIQQYWSMPPHSGPQRDAYPDIRALLEHIAERDRRIDQLEDALAECAGG